MPSCACTVVGIAVVSDIESNSRLLIAADLSTIAGSEGSSACGKFLNRAQAAPSEPWPDVNKLCLVNRLNIIIVVQAVFPECSVLSAG